MILVPQAEGAGREIAPVGRSKKLEGYHRIQYAGSKFMRSWFLMQNQYNIDGTLSIRFY
jgi:hypothetical protein